MTTTNADPRTALARPVAAEGNLPVSFSFDQMERMASAVAKSGLFAVKTPEAALTLMLVAQSEGTHPAQAMMDYDLIEGKPSLKSGAMLARFIRAGGRVEWLEQSDAKVAGKFTAPNGQSLTVSWDNERVKTAQLANRPNHQKYPMQMKRARCISEAIRALYPVTTLYTPEEIRDGAPEIDITPVSQADAVRTVVENVSATALTDAERQEHFDAIDKSADQAALAVAFAAAWKHAKEAHDTSAQAAFKAVYDARKTELTKEGQV